MRRNGNALENETRVLRYGASNEKAKESRKQLFHDIARLTDYQLDLIDGNRIGTFRLFKHDVDNFSA